MWSILLLSAISMVTSTFSANYSNGCKGHFKTLVVECDNLKLEPFESRVFNLKIAHPKEPLILNDHIFNIKGLKTLNSITIVNATIVRIEPLAFAGLPLLQTLEINSCKLPELNNLNALSNITSLKSLKITSTPLNNFQNMKSAHLEELILSMNDLEGIYNNTLSGFSSLTVVDLSNNLISKIEEGAFSNLTFLQELTLANNRLTNLSHNLFKANTELVSLDITNNPLKVFDIKLPNDIERLVLRGCELETIGQNVTSKLDDLSYLDLSQNKINFTNIAFNKVVDLDISNNSLTNLNPGIFRSNYKLQKILLDNNNFIIVPKFICTECSFEAYHYSCNNCNASILPIDIFKHFPALLTVNLAHNHLTSNNLTAFRQLHSLLELDLSFNSITYLPVEAFVKSTSLEKINLSNNKFTKIDPSVFKNNLVLKTLDFSFCSLQELWDLSHKVILSSLRQLSLVNNNLSTITPTDLSIISSIEVFELANNPLQCNENLKAMVTWLNKHEVSSVRFKTHEEIQSIDTNILHTETFTSAWNWKDMAKEKCPKQYYLEHFEGKHIETKNEVEETTQVSEDYDYHYGDFDSDEDEVVSEDSIETNKFGDDIVGKKISAILSSNQNKEHAKYSFLWPTLVFIFTSLSVLVIAANIMLLILRSTTVPRKINIPHIKIPQWNSGTKLKKHSGSVYQPLSEDKYNSCISVAVKNDYVPTHNIIQK